MLTNKESIKWLQSLKSEIGKQSNQNLWHYEEALDMIIKALQEDEWIPVSDRLPKARESVILSTKEWTGEGCYWETTKHHVIWKGYRWNATYWDDEVVAWMPLPEPYKGGDDE